MKSNPIINFEMV